MVFPNRQKSYCKGTCAKVRIKAFLLLDDQSLGSQITKFCGETDSAYVMIGIRNRLSFIDSTAVIVYIMVTNNGSQGDVAQWESA